MWVTRRFLKSIAALNRGEATAKDVAQLISDVQNRVMDEFGVKLEPEVRMIGFE